MQSELCIAPQHGNEDILIVVEKHENLFLHLCNILLN